MLPQKHWFVVQTKPSQEEKVVFYLNQKGIHTYLPKTESCFFKGLVEYKKTKPLFTGYVFAWCEKKMVCRLCWTKGVKKVLWENTTPEPIPDELIAAVKSLAGKDGLIKHRKYKPNELVKIKGGPFKDLPALFDHWESDKERVCLLLKVINAQIKVSVPASLVEAA